MHLHVLGICCCPALFAMNFNTKDTNLFYLQHEKQQHRRCGSLKLPQEAATQELSHHSRLNPENSISAALDVRMGFAAATSENRLAPSVISS